MERLNTRFELDVASAREGTFSGVASVFGNLIDVVPLTRVVPGAFKATLADRAQLARVKILYQHDSSRPIGLPLVLRETSEGLFIKAQLGNSSLARDVREDLTPLRGVGRAILDELSIGFDPIREEYVEEEGRSDSVRLLKEVKLWEISIVTWGADSKAKVREAASRRGATDAEVALDLLWMRLALSDTDQQEALLDAVAREFGGGR